MKKIKKEIERKYVDYMGEVPEGSTPFKEMVEIIGSALLLMGGLASMYIIFSMLP